MLTLIINPATDEEFSAFVKTAAEGSSDPAALQAVLRERYPRAVARSRDLDGDSGEAWYVYREGHWVQSR